MLRETVNYRDFDDNERTEELQFNLTRNEVMDLVTSGKIIIADIERALVAKDGVALYNAFRPLILKAYGQKSDDGRLFRKSAQISEDFENSAVYDQFVVDLMTDSSGSKLYDFVVGILPKDVREQAVEMAKKEMGQSGNVIPLSTQ